MSSNPSYWHQVELDVNNEPHYQQQATRFSNGLAIALCLFLLSLLWYLSQVASTEQPDAVLLPTSTHGWNGFYLLVASALFTMGQRLVCRKPLLSEISIVVAGLAVVALIQRQAGVLQGLQGVDFILWHYGALELMLLAGLLGWSAVLQSFWKQKLCDAYHRLGLLQRYFQAMLVLWLLFALMLNLPISYYQ